MAEQPGDNIRMALAEMSHRDRRLVLVSLGNRLGGTQSEDASPFGKMLEALRLDIYAMEDLERATQAAIEELGHPGIEVIDEPPEED